MKTLSSRRFDALAGYIRRPQARVFSRELEWYTDPHERVLGVLVLDRYDRDFGGAVLGQDQRGRFRAISMSSFSDSMDVARGLLHLEMDVWSKKPDSEFWQGDEKGTPVDVFVPVVPANRLNAAFRRVATEEAFTPARALIESMMPYYEDVDGNFVEQFQTTAFDSRFWELYLFALLTEQRFLLDRTFQAPDFFCRSFGDDVFLEAVTVNPTMNSFGISTEPEIPVEDAGRFREYYQEYMPIK